MAGRLVGMLAATVFLIFGAEARCQEAKAAEAEKGILSIGDQAPKLEVSKWVKGEAVEGFEPGTIYVVEFWATWCGPCRTSIPHLSKLQEEYKSRDVKVIGVSVWEESQEGVAPFVEEMGEEMSYRVAMDKVPDGKEGDSGAMAQGWMEAAGEGGIPTAFVVGKDGKVAWIGHPMSMDEPLSKIVAGEYDVALAAKERKETKELELKMAGIVNEVSTALRADKPAEAIAVIDKAIAENPKLESSQFGFIKFDLLMQMGEDEKAAAYGKSLVEGAYAEEPEVLNTLAWTLIDPESEEEASKPILKLALAAAEKASQLTGGVNPAVLDTLALAQFKNGDASKAYATQKKAVDLLGDEELDPGIRERLKMYEEANKDKDK